MVIREVFVEVGALTGLILAVLGCSQNARPTSAPAETASVSPTAPADSVSPAAPAGKDAQFAAPDAAVRPPAEFAETEVRAPARPEDRVEAVREARVESEQKTAQSVELAAAHVPIVLDDAQGAELTLPHVSLAHGHAETCRVQVGDRLPDVQLVDLEDHEQSLAKLFGATLTVVLFWNGGKPTALEELRDLGPDVLNRFSGNGVAVVGVNTGDDPQAARELIKLAGARFPNLSDRQGEAFKQVATTKVPRTYLVDASGKILWFDLEYSRTTRRELLQAIRYTLTHE